MAAGFGSRMEGYGRPPGGFSTFVFSLAACVSPPDRIGFWDHRACFSPRFAVAPCRARYRGFRFQAPQSALLAAIALCGQGQIRDLAVYEWGAIAGGHLGLQAGVGEA